MVFEYLSGTKDFGKEQIHLEVKIKIDMSCVGRSSYLISKATKGKERKRGKEKKKKKESA